MLAAASCGAVGICAAAFLLCFLDLTELHLHGYSKEKALIQVALPKAALDATAQPKLCVRPLPAACDLHLQVLQGVGGDCQAVGALD